MSTPETFVLSGVISAFVAGLSDTALRVEALNKRVSTCGAMWRAFGYCGRMSQQFLVLKEKAYCHDVEKNKLKAYEMLAIHGKKVHEVNTFLASVNLPLMNVPPPARNNNFTTTVQQPAPSTPLAPRSNYANPTNSGTTLTSAPTTPQSSQPPPTTDLNPFTVLYVRHPVINGNAMAVSTAPARSNTPAPPPEPVVPSRGDRPQMTLNEARQQMIDEELVATDARAVERALDNRIRKEEEEALESLC